MNITTHILDVLKERNKAAVQGFGVFSLKNSQAKIDDETGNLLPPAKEINFEVDYETADGNSLIKFISEKENISFSEAESELKKLTDYWKKQLTETENLSVEGVGKFIHTDNELKFFGERIEALTPDFYGLEEINLKNLKSKSGKTASNGEYKFNKAILFTFLLIVPVAGLAVLAFTQKERIFGKKSFNDLSVQTATHRIKKDSLRLQRAKNDSIRLANLKADSLRIDSLKKDSIAKTFVAPAKKVSKKSKYTKNKWGKQKAKRRVNR